jgi:hypothetical protein
VTGKIDARRLRRSSEVYLDPENRTVAFRFSGRSGVIEPMRRLHAVLKQAHVTALVGPRQAGRADVVTRITDRRA